MKIRHLILFCWALSSICACVPSSRLKTAKDQISRLEINKSRVNELDSLLRLEKKKNSQLADQLDKTERVLATIYTQFSGNIPKKVNATDQQNLKAEIVQQNLELSNTNKYLQKLIDSLTQIKQAISIPEVNNTASKSDKKNSENLKTIETLRRYIQTLESNYNSEFEKNKQLNKSLNAYSLKLEIMDNERLKEIQDLRQSFALKINSADSLYKLTSAQASTIEQLESKLNKLNTSEIKESKKSKKENQEFLNLNTKLAESQKLLKNAQHTIDSSSDKLQNLSKEIQIANIKINSDQRIIEDQKKQIEKLLVNSQMLSQEIQKLKEIHLQVEQNNNLESTIKDLQSKNKILGQELSIEKSKSEDLVSKLAKLETKYQDLESKKTDSNDSIKINQLLLQNSDLSSNNLMIKEKFSNLEIENKSRTREINNLNEQIGILNESVNNKNKQILELSKKASKSNLSKTSINLRDSLNQKDRTISDLQQIIAGQNSKSLEDQRINEERLKALETKIKMLEESNIVLQNLSKTEMEISQVNSIGSNKSDSVNIREKATSVNPPLNSSTKVKVKASSKKSRTLPLNDSENNNFDQLVKKLETVLKTYNLSNASVSRQESNIVLSLPQNALFLDNTFALNERGAAIVSKMNSILLPWKLKQMDIIGFGQHLLNPMEFHFNRAQTIGKLMIALGATTSTINYGSREYQLGIDSEKCVEGIELLIRTD